MESRDTESKYAKLISFGVFGPVVAISFTLLDVFISPWFSWYTSALSDLGVHQYGFLFNGGLLIEAASNLLFVFALRKLKYASLSVSMLLAVAGLSLGLVGIFNEHYVPLHLIFALVYFIIFPVAIILFSSSRNVREGYSKAVGYICSLVGLIFIIVGIVQDFNVFNTGLGLGVYEFVEAFLLSIWTIYTAAFYFAPVLTTEMREETLEEKS